MSESNVYDFWINEPSECYRHQNLVYVSNFKCASWYHRDLFLYNQWCPTKLNDIDWEEDHVFGFIRDPMTIRIHGITTDIFRLDPKFVTQFLDLPDLFFENLPGIGPHSIPMSLRFGMYASLIDWIPIDIDVAANDLFAKLLDYHKISLQALPAQFLDDGEDMTDHHKVREIIKIKSASMSHSVWRTWSRDLDLYRSVIINFDPRADQWNDISWLKLK